MSAMNIAVIGTGRWARALAGVLKGNQGKLRACSGWPMPNSKRWARALTPPTRPNMTAI